MDALSDKLGFSIYIPAVVNIFSFFQNFLRLIKPDVLVKETLVRKKNLLGFLLVVTTKKSQSEFDMSKCEPLAKDLEKCRNIFHSSNSTTDGKRTVTYSKTWVPGFGVKNNCHVREANELEKQLFENNKKDNK